MTWKQDSPNRQLADRIGYFGECTGALPKGSLEEQLYFLNKSIDFHQAMEVFLLRSLRFMCAHNVKDQFLEETLIQSKKENK